MHEENKNGALRGCLIILFILGLFFFLALVIPWIYKYNEWVRNF